MISIKLRTGKSLKVNEGIKVCGPEDAVQAATEWLCERVQWPSSCCNRDESVTDVRDSKSLTHLFWIARARSVDESVDVPTDVILRVHKVAGTKNFVVTFLKPNWDSSYIIER